MPKLSVKIEAVTTGLSAGLKKAQQSIKQFGQSAKRISVGLLAFGSATIGAIAKIGQMAGQLKQTELAMETFLGSSEKAKQLISDLRQFADVTPFDTNSVIQAGKVLAGAGVEAGNTVDVIKMLGDISAGTGKDLGEMAQLYAKSMNKGKVQTEELLQLVNAGVPIIDKLAKSMNRPKEAIFKMAELGKIKFKDLQQVFKDMTSEGGIYSGLMEKQSKTLLGKWSTLQGKIQNLTADIGGPLQNSLISITDTFTDWAKQARNLSGPIGLLIKDLRVVADLMESTRKGGSLEKTTGLKGYGKTDLIADSLARGSTEFMGMEINPLAAIGRVGQMMGFGAQARGQQAGLGSGDAMDMQKRQTEAMEKVAENTSKQGYN